MSQMAILLVLVSAFLHAFWNFLSKKSGGGVVFVWLFTGVGVLAYGPIVLLYLYIGQPDIEWGNMYFVLGSILLHLLYFVALQIGYRKGDFSLVYPIARGTGPILVSVMAVALLDEKPSIWALVGTVLILGSVFFLSGGAKAINGKQPVPAILHGMMIGSIIAGYTIWDKYMVSFLLLPPLLLDYFTTLGRFIFLTPVALRNKEEVWQEWKAHRIEAIGVGILNSLAYILVLRAMVLSPVSYVAPLRESSILIGTLLGVYILREDYGWRRILASCTIVAGVIIIVIN